MLIILLNLRFIFLNQPVGDKAKQEDQSEEGSHGNHGQNDAEQFEVQSRHLRRQVVSLGFPDVPEQNYDRQVLWEKMIFCRSKINVLTFNRSRKIP